MNVVDGGGSSLRLRLLGLAMGLIGALLVPAAAFAIDEFPVPAGTHPGGITTGPDGNIWFTEEGTNGVGGGIGRMTTAGAYTHFPLPNIGSVPDQITLGPDGRLWFTEAGGNRIGAITTAGAITEYNNNGNGVGGSPSGITVGPDGTLWYTAVATSSIRQILTNGTLGASFTTPTGASDPSDIELGPDGRLWFTEQAATANKIGALNISTGGIQEFPTPTPGSEPSGIIATTGGVLWFTESAISAIGKISPVTGVITEFGGAGFSPSGIAAAQDGALWYTLGFGGGSPTVPCTGTGDHSIGRITSGGTITNKFATPTPISDPSDITVGPDGALWFSEFCGDKIGRIVTGGGAPPPPPPVAVLSVSSLKMSPSAFKAAPKGASIAKKKKKKGKTGTKVSYTLSAAASTKFTVERSQKGRKKGKKCVAPKRSNRKRKKCTRYVKVKGSFKHAGVAGKNTFKFSGRVGGKKLKPGNYRLIAVATTGASTSPLKRKSFRIVR